MDPRAARTRALLQDALFALVEAHDLADISVTDVTDLATVNRSTFYQHYSDIESLLADALDREAALAGAHLAALTADEIPTSPPPVLVRYCEHLAAHAPVYRRALGPHGSPLAVARLRDSMRQSAAAALRVHGSAAITPTTPLEIVAAGIAGSLTGVVVAWLDMDPMPGPDVAVGWMWHLLTGPRGVAPAP